MTPLPQPGVAPPVPAADPIVTAKDKAWAEHKSLVIEYGASWCGPCKVVAAKYGADIRAKGVYVHVDKDKDVAIIERHPWLAVPRPLLVPRVVYYENVRGELRPPKVYVGSDQIELWIKQR
jgi:thiol-disulfide isomerase/thioredoxin